MKIYASLLALGILAVLGGACGELHEKELHEFGPATKVSLTPRKNKYFLGENILLDYTVSHAGAGRLSVHMATGLGTDSYHLIVTDEAGRPAPRSPLRSQFTGSMSCWVVPGDSETFTIPLVRYCRLEKPGIYRIRAAHDFGWSPRDPQTRQTPAVPEGDPRWATAKIEVVMPDASEARRVVEGTRNDRLDVEHYRHLAGFEEMEDYADFVCLHYPIYLPILEQLAAGKNGDKRALVGIAHIATPEATDALLRLVQHTDDETVRRATSALCDRLPDPPGPPRRERRNPTPRDDVTECLVKPAWRPEQAAAARQSARTMLAEQEPSRLRSGAYILEAIGTAEDVPALIAALDRIVPVVERTGPAQYVGEIPPVRQASLDLIHATEAIAGRGVPPAAQPRTPGEILHFVLSVKQRERFRPDGWDKRCVDWVGHGTPYLQEAVLVNAPHPLPESLGPAYRAGVRQLIGTTRHRSVVHVAVQRAVDFHVPTDELLGILAERLDSHEVYEDVVMCLEDLLRSGRHEHRWAVCAYPLDEEGTARAKAAWKRFLKQHGQALRNGQRFNPSDLGEIVREMFP